MTDSHKSDSAQNPLYSTNEYGVQFNQVVPTAPAIKVPAATGILWYKQGWSLFTAQPGYWYLAVLIFIIYSIILGLLPYIGSIIGALFGPVVSAGFLTFSRRIDTTGKAEISDLFAGFKLNTGSLIILGLIYLVAVFLIIIVCGLLYTFAVASGSTTNIVSDPSGSSGSSSSSSSSSSADSIYGAITTFDPTSGWWVVILGLVLYMLLSSAMLYAPGLIAFGKLKVGEALKQSFHGLWRNWAAHLVFFLVWVLVGLVVGGIVYLVARSGVSWSVTAAIGTIVGLIGVLLWPLYYTTYYSAFKDLYKWSVEVLSPEELARAAKNS